MSTSRTLSARVALLEDQIAYLSRQLRTSPRSGLEFQLVAAISAENLPYLHFTAAELVAYSEAVAGAYLLRATLQLLGAQTPMKLGKLLQRLEGREIDGRMVRRVSRESAGTIWVISSVAPSPREQ